MVYVKKNAQGRVVAVSLVAGEGLEMSPSDAPEVEAFFGRLRGEEPVFTESDLSLVRVLEDVIALLVDRGVIRFTDLPEPARLKLMERESLRKDRRGLDLMVDADDVI